MPVKHFGIFLAYGPTVDLRKEGLGRLLAAFLKAAATREDVRFVIACPQWSKRSLLAFLESEAIPASAFDFVSPAGMPFVLRLYLAYLARRISPPKKSLLARLFGWIRRRATQHVAFLERHLITTRNPILWFLIALYAIILGIVFLPLAALVWLVRRFAAVVLTAVRSALDSLRAPIGDSEPAPEPSNALRKVDPPRFAHRLVHGVVHRVGSAVGTTHHRFRAYLGGLTEDLYRLMEEAETQRIREKVDALPHVRAWFSPTAFWPAFNEITAPCLLCVPDVLPVDFPVGFAGDTGLLKTFETVERSIRGGQHFVTYSGNTKWRTLVDRYAVDPEDVSVVPHACWDLSPWIKVSGFADEERATRGYCESLLQRALVRTGTDGYIKGIDSGSVRFLFYASQFRPNKNLVTLLQAYEHLLRERFIHHKLILTGEAKRSPPVLEFVRERGLGRDVLFLHGLTTPELTACYHLADLAVNPSLSEGGCPFTLTEALSVNTPVVMARIPVTEEVIVDPELQEMMLFDPYDYRDASTRIEWALNHRESLLSVQKEVYARLRQRTWRTVVDDYVEILDGLADSK